MGDKESGQNSGKRKVSRLSSVCNVQEKALLTVTTEIRQFLFLISLVE